MTHAIIITIMALAALGVWTAMGEGMVLHWFNRYVTGPRTFWPPTYHAFFTWHWPLWMQKPLATCPRCMVTIYGTSAVLALGFTFPLWYWPVYLVAAVGLQEMLHR